MAKRNVPSLTIQKNSQFSHQNIEQLFIKWDFNVFVPTVQQFDNTNSGIQKKDVGPARTKSSQQRETLVLYKVYVFHLVNA